ncbi:LPXTG cell wall anchor domain-containing protein [Lentzea sp. NPDC003310]|uniref:LPXTG cell wall anchor domain-containing protein n=1 Tax=Lentzea sp. NPDC003310 TaxID=3154447 RepID=UPI00339E339B
MRNTFAVATTAALVLTATGTPALAQDETISITGRVFVDRNGNGVFDEGDGVRVGGPGVRITGDDGFTTDLPVGPSGMYRVQKLKKSTYKVETLDVVNYTTAKSSYTTSETVTAGDFALVGQVVTGIAYVDANGDGTKQADENAVTQGIRVTGTARDGSPIDITRTAGANGAYRFDLELGDVTLTAPLLNGDGLVLGKPNAAKDIDWATYTRKLTAQTEQVDLRYITAAANITVKGALVPAKDTYLVGEQITAKVQLVNTGNAPVLPTIGLGQFHAKVLRHSDNLEAESGTQFELKHRIVPGATEEVELTFTATGTIFTAFMLVVFNEMRGLKDVDTTDNLLQIAAKVVEKGAETTAPTTTTTTAAPVTTTTTQAVAQAGNKSGLASTGASPLGFLALGALLLAAGTSAFFFARRRRS